jgi:hypothetical protein
VPQIFVPRIFLLFVCYHIVIREIFVHEVVHRGFVGLDRTASLNVLLHNRLDVCPRHTLDWKRPHLSAFTLYQGDDGALLAAQRVRHSGIPFFFSADVRLVHFNDAANPLP